MLEALNDRLFEKSGFPLREIQCLSLFPKFFFGWMNSTYPYQISQSASPGSQKVVKDNSSIKSKRANAALREDYCHITLEPFARNTWSMRMRQCVISGQHSEEQVGILLGPPI